MGEFIVTFETIFDFSRQEKERAELTRLSPTFYEESGRYLNEKICNLEKSSKKATVFAEAEAEQLGIQVSNIRKVLRELYHRREKKVVEAALNKARTGVLVDTSAMLPHEKVLFEELCKTFSGSRSLLDKLIEPRVAGVLVKFVTGVDTFVGKELEEYGPFKADEQVRLPVEIARILVDSGKAVEIQG